MPAANLAFPLPDLTPDLTRQVGVHLLDDPQEWSAFSRLEAKNAGCWESNLMIEGMHCAACALTIEDVLLGVPGVVAANVSAGSHRARVVWAADAVLPSGWMRAIEAAGYRAVPANDAFSRERRLAESRKALWRLAVAGLCMMQVMMYAYPAYVAAPGDLMAEMEQLLRWASWVLTLPVILFSCGPFFSSAWRDVLKRRVTMMAGPWLWLRVKTWRGGQGRGNLGIRLAGLALAASSAWTLWMGFMHNTAPWCITP